MYFRNMCFNVLAVCSRPPLTNEMDPAGFQRVYEVGAEVFLSCKPGHTPSKGSRRVVCTASGKWTNPTLKCERETLLLSRHNGWGIALVC